MIRPVKIPPLLAPLVAAALAADGRAQVFDFAVEGLTAGDGFGDALSQVGDVDKDGCEDFVVGAPTGHSGDGEIVVFSGRTGGEIARRHGRTGSRFGQAVDGRIDVDHDGYPDVLIGAPTDDTNGADAGRVLIYSPHLDRVLLDVHGSVAGAKLGSSVRAMQGDLDGDGTEDFIVGAPFIDSAYVLSGKDGSVLFQETGQAGSLFGTSVASAGKVDGDNFVDFAVGSTWYQNSTGTVVGRVAAFSGKDGSRIWAIDGAARSFFGYCIARPGDLDGDGHPDLVVGAPEAYDAALSTWIGSVTAISGASGSPLYTVYGTATGDEFGASVRAFGGDVDGDGTNDYVVGADQAGGTAVGYAQMISGATGAPLYTIFQATDDPTHAGYFGVAVAGGDANGDGKPDVVVGASGFDSNRGLVEVWHSAVASWSNYGSGFAGALGVPSLTARENPVVGQTLHVDLSDSATGATTGFLALGFVSLSLPTSLGGTLLVAPIELVPLAIPTTGLTLTATLPDDPTLLGVQLYLQSFELDPGAAKGWSFTPGLELLFGFQ